MGRVQSNQASNERESDKGDTSNGNRKLFLVTHLIRVSVDPKKRPKLLRMSPPKNKRDRDPTNDAHKAHQHLRCKEFVGFRISRQGIPFLVTQESVKRRGRVHLVLLGKGRYRVGSGLHLKRRREASNRQEDGNNQLHFVVVACMAWVVSKSWMLFDIAASLVTTIIIIATTCTEKRRRTTIQRESDISLMTRWLVRQCEKSVSATTTEYIFSIYVCHVL